MTRDQFLDEYIKKSGTPLSARTEGGIKDGHFERVAEPCQCGEYLCPGWRLVPRKDDYSRLSGGAIYTVTTHPK